MKACGVAWKHPARFSPRRCASCMALVLPSQAEQLTSNTTARDTQVALEQQCHTGTERHWLPRLAQVLRFACTAITTHRWP
jgi:hypothetical protein